MFNQYPYLNIQDLNLDYIIKAIKEMRYEVTNFVSINAIKYADPIQWNITSQYEKNTIVIDPVTGTAYISVAPVPAGVALTRPEYWTVVFDLGSFVTRAAQNFTSHWESDTTTTATFPSNAGNWLVWGDVLYRALVNITAGDTYVVGSNIEHFTIEDLYNAYLNTVTSILNMIGDLTDLTTADTTSIVNAINSAVSDYNLKIGDITNLTTSDRDNVVDAINEIQNHIVNDINPHITSIVNVLDLGVIPNDPTKGTENVTIINAALAQHKYLFFPVGAFYIDAPVVVRARSGIIGESPYSSAITCTGDFNCVEVPVSVDDLEGVTTSVVVKGLTLLGTLGDNTPNYSKGLYIYNYTFNVTCNRDETAYQAYNNGYALEYRCCDFSNLRIGAFQHGIYTDNFTSILTIRDCFLVYCQEAGLYAASSDSIFENIFVTFCYFGMQIHSELNKIVNCKIYMNGHIWAGSTHVDPSAGLSIFSQWARDIVVSATDIQENKQNGLLISDGAHNIILAGVVCDANGFDTSDTNNIGFLATNAYNISGVLTCTDKNATPTQRIGCYIDPTCHDFNILYNEWGNINPIQLAGYYTYNMLKHNSNMYFSQGVLNTTYFANQDESYPWLFYDGEHMDIHFKIKIVADVGSSVEILNMSDIFSHFPTAGVMPNQMNVAMYELTTATIRAGWIDLSSGKLYTGQAMSHDEVLELDLTWRPKYWA